MYAKFENVPENLHTQIRYINKNSRSFRVWNYACNGEKLNVGNMFVLNNVLDPSLTKKHLLKMC